MLAGKLLQLYLRSKNAAFQHKRESYVIFKLNLAQFIADELGVLALLLQVFLRLARRGEGHLPRLERIDKLVRIGAQPMEPLPDIQEYK
jgi:hypothetical protein